jgi:hypothetical protein
MSCTRDFPKSTLAPKEASPFKLLLGNWFMDDVSTNDHSIRFYTTTFTTIDKYLKSNDSTENLL